MNDWKPQSGIFILVNLQGDLADRIHAIQQRYDPRMARFAKPHFTLIGSSGAGPIDASTSITRLHQALDPIAQTTEPITMHFKRPVRYMQTNTFALPLDEHGPLRILHDRIKRSGLTFAHPRYAFTPHVTLSHYRPPTDSDARELLGTIIEEPFIVDHLVVSLTAEPSLPRELFELELTGGLAQSAERKHKAQSA